MNSRDPPSKILLLIISCLPHSFPLTNDYLFDMFKSYGDINKILIFERGKTNKAFIEYSNIKHAILARRNMMGKQITPQGGKLLIHFSHLKQLNLEVVDQTRGTSYQQSEVETQLLLNSVSKIKIKNNKENIQCQQVQSSQVDFTNQNQIRVAQDIGESPNKTIMESQLKQLIQILDDDYNNEIEKSQQIQFDQQQQIIHQLLYQKPSKYLIVSNIDIKVTSKMLYNLFNRFGHLENLILNKKQQTAILKFLNSDQATIAKELLNNVLFFNKELRILFHQQQDDLRTLNIDEELYIGSKTKFKIVPISKVLFLQGIKDIIEIQNMVKLVGMIQDIRLEYNQIKITMVDIYEALKVISVFSEYEYKGNKINIFFK
ncbi:unnamed protein product [Paramecium pentaurelia]|uniref:RRM domain-containing protein n=1 Tax=Paramecium pentaurelia TaxID=43138 RepID=A0A8S1T1S7_9CILI|nr:unnamed protein product [Paramecium pentaurelia]